MTIDLDYVKKYVYVALASWGHNALFEDAVQEGMIRAWRDVEAGMTDQAHVNHRAKVWALNYLKDGPTGRRQATGTPARSVEGREDSRGVQSREKITQYVTEYQKLHDKNPTNQEVSQATGLSIGVVSAQRRNIREGRAISNAIYTNHYGERRIDFKAYSIGHITPENQDALFDTAGIVARSSVSFESDSISEMDFYGLLGKVSKEHRQVLFWYHVMGYQAKEIAVLLGFAPVSNTGARRIKDAHEAVRAILDPSSVETTPPKRKYPAKRKPREYKKKPPQTHCSRGHEIRGWRPAPKKRYCKICNNLRMFPGKTVDDIPADSRLWKWDEGARP